MPIDGLERSCLFVESPSRVRLEGIIRHSQFHKSLVSAIQLGELTLTTLPGEPSSGIGLALAEEVETLAREQGQGSPRSFNIGYAQDHQFYLLDPDDWTYGGYESSMGAWGPYYGRFVVERALEVTRSLLTYTSAMSNQVTPQPTWWTDLIDDDRAPPENAPTNAEIIVQPPTQLSRGTLLRIQWIGGDPAVDLPTIKVVHANDLSMATLKSGQPLDDRSFSSTLKYLGNYEQDQRWESTWDLPLNLDTGEYRLEVNGQMGTDA